MYFLYRYLLIISVAALIFPTRSDAQTRQLVQLKTVVIDAGHGGKDPGTIKGNVQEKNITLSVAKALGNMIQSRAEQDFYHSLSSLLGADILVTL